MPIMPGTTENSVENLTDRYAYAFSISEIPCGYDEHDAEIERVWTHRTWEMWDDFLDGRSSFERRNREVNRNLDVRRRYLLLGMYNRNHYRQQQRLPSSSGLVGEEIWNKGNKNFTL